MNVAILSDIHSNFFALEAVMNEFDQYKIDKVIVLGDIFGYYPWANETYELLLPYLDNSFIIKGNHDQLLLELESPSPEPSYWAAAKQNESELKIKNPSAIEWVRNLPLEITVTINQRHIYMFHGTPENKVEGRYYPDDQADYLWLPKQDEVILLGHTHYSIYKKTKVNGIIINPGSVGQPRDGNPMPSWGILNTLDFDFQIKRTNYDNFKAMDELEKRQWDKRAIAALNKTNQGKLI